MVIIIVLHAACSSAWELSEQGSVGVYTIRTRAVDQD